MRTAPNFIDLSGKTFGKRVVLNREATVVYNGKKGNSRWRVRCECGSVKVIDSSNLKKSTSCGCDKEYAIRSGASRRKPRPINEPRNASHLKRTFNLSVPQFEEMLAKQGGACALCGDMFVRTPHVDHDHSCCPGNKSCGKCVRGLLCHFCNTGMGNLKDSIELLEKAIAYLKKRDHEHCEAAGIG